MRDLNTELTGNRDAVSKMLATADTAAAVWTVPRMPGKWSPSQLVEHVARALDESANLVAGRPAAFPKLPFFIRPLAKSFFNKTLKNSAFSKAKTNGAMNPESGPASPAEGRVRVEAALARFEQACRARPASDQVVKSATFGSVLLADWVRFQGLHARHHQLQLPNGAA